MIARIDLLYTPNCMSGTLLSVIDVLRAANKLWQLNHPRKRSVPLGWRIIDARGKVLALPPWLGEPTPLPESKLAPERTALLVPGLWMKDVPELTRIVEVAIKETALIAARYEQGGVIAASFNGSVLLARAGVLDGKYSSVTWLIAAWFSKNFPQVKLQMDRPVTQDGTIFCAGAPASHIDLAIALIRHFVDDDLAQTCANAFNYRLSRFKQSSIAISNNVTRDGVIYKAKQWLEHHVEDPYQLELVAQAAAVSSRTLLRHFHDVTNMSPLDYLHKLRIERAKQLLEITLLDLPSIMAECGYQDASSFRRLFRRETGMSPSQYRRAYTLRVPRQWWRADDSAGSVLMSGKDGKDIL